MKHLVYCSMREHIVGTDYEQLPDSYLQDEWSAMLLSNQINPDKIRKKDGKLLRSMFRGWLHKRVGMFYKIENDPVNDHPSTRERKPYAKELYDWLRHDSVLDIGCGVNILLLPSFDRYIGVDLMRMYLDIVQAHGGETFHHRADDPDFLRGLPPCNVAYMFKLLDLVEKNGHKMAESMIDAVPCKEVVVSFPTKTLSGKPMNHPQRGWVLRMCERRGWNVEEKMFYNEVYYRVTKISA